MKCHNILKSFSKFPVSEHVKDLMFFFISYYITEAFQHQKIAVCCQY